MAVMAVRRIPDNKIAEDALKGVQGYLVRSPEQSQEASLVRAGCFSKVSILFVVVNVGNTQLFLLCASSSGPVPPGLLGK